MHDDKLSSNIVPLNVVCQTENFFNSISFQLECNLNIEYNVWKNNKCTLYKIYHLWYMYMSIKLERDL